MIQIRYNFILLCAIVAAASDSSSNSIHNEDKKCPCKLLRQPNLQYKEETARWMVHSLDWGVLSTLSSRFSTANGDLVPFGNIYSFVDGTCDNSTGIPFIYGTYMDQSFQDSMVHSSVSLALSEASLASVCGGSNLRTCQTLEVGGDPESPLCARLTLVGELVVLTPDEHEEFQFAQQALFQRHASMKEWPHNHNWVIAKIDIQEIWLIDYFGGASILDVDKYLRVQLTPQPEEPA